jgi:hypothetical protein
MLGLRERKFDNYVVVSLPFTAEKMLADRSSNDQIYAHAIPTFTRKGKIHSSVTRKKRIGAGIVLEQSILA